MEDLVFKRPRMANQFGTFPLAAGGALVMQIPSAVYQLALGLAVIPLVLLVARERSTKVTAAGITVRTLRNRFIPWEQVDAITVDGFGGDAGGTRETGRSDIGQTGATADTGSTGATADPGKPGGRAVAIHLLDGSRLRLPEPVERRRRTLDPDFDAKYSAIVAAWLRSSAPAPADADLRPGG